MPEAGPFVNGHGRHNRPALAAHAEQESHEMSLYRLAVADVMTMDPITIHAAAPVEEAVELLTAYRITGLPVVDERERLVGVVSQSDLLAIQPLIRAAVRGKPDGLKVGEVMSSPALTVPMSASLVEGARIMRDNAVHRLVALDDDGNPVGVLSGSDYVSLVAEG
jgi:CBS domain-containing protein